MKAGRELDALVALHVMGWAPYTEQRGEYTHWLWFRVDKAILVRAQDKPRMNVDPATFNPRKHIESGLPKFSTDIASAWEVVEKLGAEGFALHLKAHRHENPPPGEEHEAFFWGKAVHREAFASTTPLAICLAALKLAGVSSQGSPE